SEPPPADEGERRKRTCEPSDPARGVQEAHAGAAGVKQIECRNDDQHVERAGHERLEPVEAYEQAQLALERDRRAADPRGMSWSYFGCALSRPRLRRADPAHEEPR